MTPADFPDLAGVLDGLAGLALTLAALWAAATLTAAHKR